jgi:hypothetical protein
MQPVYFEARWRTASEHSWKRAMPDTETEVIANKKSSSI